MMDVPEGSLERPFWYIHGRAASPGGRLPWAGGELGGDAVEEEAEAEVELLVG